MQCVLAIAEDLSTYKLGDFNLDNGHLAFRYQDEEETGVVEAESADGYLYTGTYNGSVGDEPDSGRVQFRCFTNGAHHCLAGESVSEDGERASWILVFDAA
jgi:hypothetical protein